MKIRSLMVLISVVISTNLQAQSIDSLKKVIVDAPTDSLKAVHSLSIAECYSRINKDSFFYYSQRAVDYAKISGASIILYKGNENLAYYYRTEGEYDSALYYYQMALAIKVADSSLLPKTYYSLGNVYKAKGELDVAGEHYLKSLRLAESSGNIQGAAIANLGLGGLFLTQKKVEISIDHFTAALAGFQEVQDSQGVYIATNNVGTGLFEQKNYKAAKPHFLKALDMAVKFNDRVGLSDIYSNLGIIYDQERQLDSSEFFHSNALQLRKRFNLKEGIIRSYHNLVATSIHLKNLQDAEAYLDSAYQINADLNNLEESKYYWSYRTQLDTARKDFESAFHSLAHWHFLRDSIENIEVSNRISELKTQYETEKKDSEIASLSQQSQIQALMIGQRNTQLFGAGVVMILMILGGYVFYNQRKIRHQQAVSEMEQRMLRLQMNPHFIFNALASIQSYILRSDTKESVSYLAKFGKLMRQILEHSREEFITLAEEVDMLTNYLEIQQLRFSNRFDFQIHIAPSLTAEEVKIPPLFAQPFVENAIEHGLKEKVADGLIQVRFKHEDGVVLLEVEDNGVGIGNAEGDKKSHTSLATKITKERLAIFEQKFKRKYRLGVNQLNQGTLASIFLPRI